MALSKVQKWIDLRQTKIKMIIGPFYTYRQIHSPAKVVSFCDWQPVICKYTGGQHVAVATWLYGTYLFSRE